MTTDHNEALRLADDWEPRSYEVASMIRRQVGRIAELEKRITNLHTTMFAAAMEIQEHWDAHCDADGYGPINLVNRLEKGIAAQYGYDAETLHRAYNQIDELRVKVNAQQPHQHVVKMGEI